MDILRCLKFNQENDHIHWNKTTESLSGKRVDRDIMRYNES